MASVREVFGDDFGSACDATFVGGTSIDGAFKCTVFATCHDPAPIVDALHGVHAYKELQAYEASAAVDLSLAMKRRGECLGKLREARAAVNSCASLLSDESKPYIDAIDVVIREKTLEHDAIVQKRTETHVDASRRARDVMMAIMDIVKLVRDPTADPPTCMTCPVCMDAPVDTCFVECGHTVCGKCAKKCYMTGEDFTDWKTFRCHMCRSTTTAVTLRFSMGN
jgi:hypothetical protein